MRSVVGNKKLLAYGSYTLTMINLSSNISRCGVLALLILIRLIASEAVPYEYFEWRFKSRGLGVGGGSTKKEPNNMDSMGKLVKGEKEEGGNSQEIPKTIPGKKSPVSKGHGGMKNGKKIKGTSSIAKPYKHFIFRTYSYKEYYSSGNFSSEVSSSRF